MFQYSYRPLIESTTCIICGHSSPLISRALKICGGCIKNKPEVPRGRGVKCKLCANECIIPESEPGYCGLRKNMSGRLVHLASTHGKAIVQCYDIIVRLWN